MVSIPLKILHFDISRSQNILKGVSGPMLQLNLIT
jgi:hypothetical protein